MNYRFPVGDAFVDYFSSRDTDSLLIEREREAVDEWIENKKLYHIMRDSFSHNTEILGGLVIEFFIKIRIIAIISFRFVCLVGFC